MILTIDLGNTSVKAGIFDGDNLILHSFLDHPAIPTILVYQQWLKPMLE